MSAMDLLDRLLGHDAWTTRRLLLLCHGLSEEQLDRDFDIAHRTVRATFEHIIRNMEVWTGLMAGGSIRAMGGKSVEQLLGRLDRAAADLARVAHGVALRGTWNEYFVDTLDDPPRRKTFGAAIAHLITHGMHHRAQLLYMLRRLGVKDLPEGDVFSWENRSPGA
jgi:uncharacterized damage-inducible protein DinB